MKIFAAVLLCVATAVVARTLSAAEQPDDQFGSAIDAQGIRHVGRSYGGPAPWLADAIFRPKPDYPFSERHLHHEGVAVFRLEIDLKTGSTTNVNMIQSSGYPKLDDVAFSVLRRWRLRPDKWKQVDVPVVFTLSPLRPGEPLRVRKEAP
jgi:TonB family protein